LPQPADDAAPDAVAQQTQWTQWREATFGDPYLVWHNGADFTALTSAARSDPETVAGMLRIGLHADDPLAAESIGALAAAGLAPADARQLLTDAARTTPPHALVQVAQTLHQLTGDQSWADPIATVLASTEHWGVRIDAAMALAEFAPTAHLIEVLAEAVTDPEYLVRYHSSNTLLRYAGNPVDIGEHPTLFDRITEESADAARSAWQQASDELAAAAREAH
jgi:hypothetical protein